MKNLTIKEKKSLGLLCYKSNKSNVEEQTKDSRARIRKALKEFELSNISDLITYLNNKKRQKAKELKLQNQIIKKQKEKDTKKLRIKVQIDSLIKTTSLVTPPTLQEAKDLIRFKDYKSLTNYAREYYLENKLFGAFAHIHRNKYNTGAHNNYYNSEKSEKLKIEVVETNDWGVYSKRIKYPAKHYTFTLHLPKKHSFICIEEKLVIIQGVKLDVNGMVVSWFEQSRGMSLRIEEGFCIKGELVKKTKTIQTLSDAQNKIAILRNDIALKRTVKINNIFGQNSFQNDISGQKYLSTGN